MTVSCFGSALVLCHIYIALCGIHIFCVCVYLCVCFCVAAVFMFGCVFISGALGSDNSRGLACIDDKWRKIINILLLG